MSYVTLQIGVGWLKNLDPLVTDAQQGLTAADVAKAEVAADRAIDAFFGRYYDIGTAAFRSAPMVLEIAEMLASARLIEIKFAQDPNANTALAGALEADAKQKMAELRTGGLRDANGNLIAPVARASSRVENLR